MSVLASVSASGGTGTDAPCCHGAPVTTACRRLPLPSPHPRVAIATAGMRQITSPMRPCLWPCITAGNSDLDLNAASAVDFSSAAFWR